MYTVIRMESGKNFSGRALFIGRTFGVAKTFLAVAADSLLTEVYVNIMQSGAGAYVFNVRAFNHIVKH